MTDPVLMALTLFPIFPIDAAVFLGDMGYDAYDRYDSLAVQILIHLFCIVSDVMCLAGTIKSRTYLLLPFIAKTSLSILGSVTVIIVMCPRKDARGMAYYHTALIPLIATIEVSIYFLIIVYKYFQHMSSVMDSGKTDKAKLQL